MDGQAERTRASSRVALVEAALAEFTAKGYEAATVASIAERAGVTTGALYAHFDGKLDLLVETLGLETTGEIMRMFAAVADKPWPEVAAELARELATPPDPGRLLLLDLIVVARRDPAVAETLRRGLDRYLRALGAAARLGTEAGLVDPALGLHDLTRLFALLSLGMHVFAALDEAPPSEEAFALMVDMLLRSGEARADVDTEPAALARVRTRAEVADRARRRLHDGMVEAVAAGHSLRQVGAAAGLSHERVRRLLRERGDPPA